MADQQAMPDFGSNSWVVDEMYRDYLENPASVAESWQEFFSDYQPAGGNGSAPAATVTSTTPAAPGATVGPAGAAEQQLPPNAKPLRGGAAVIADNMNASRSVPTATSIRVVPAKLLEVNRIIVNNQLGRVRGGKLSFTHLIGWAIVKAMGLHPVMRTSYHEVDGRGYAVTAEQLNLGLAIDVERKGAHTLLVPNIKASDTLDFAGFWQAYELVVRAVKTNKLDPAMFAGTTATLTNPGTVGTVGSVPRLMPGQSVIVGVGAIDFPAEYQGADPRSLAAIAVGKVVTITSTYDHRVIQGAESGLFLKAVHELLLGEHDFYAEIFDSLHIPYAPVAWHRDERAGIGRRAGDGNDDKQVAVGKLINAYRVRGHLIANLNPLSTTFKRVPDELDPANYGLTIWDLDREFATGGVGGRDRMALGRALSILRDAYCRTVGVEYMFIADPDQKAWIQERVEGAKTALSTHDQRHLLESLNAAEAFERFLHTKFIGHKRFSLEGAESVIPMLDALLSAAADDGVTDAVLGMAHRGRLNVLANILHKSYRQIFREFEGDVDPDSVQGSGDVKYHLGASGSHTSPSGRELNVMLSSNPSHLEAVDAVVEGMARAKLDIAGTDGSSWPVLPVVVHGDAAFAGQGVVAETFAMSQLRGYRTGGTVHVVVNNQVGFTTAPEQGRSSQYATDVAKMVMAPIFHVNGDDPEACVRVMRLALEFRQAFAKDVVVEMVCYRRWGHNEGDDPSYTQPLMYRAIEGHRSVRKLYTEELVTRGDISVEDAEHALDDFRQRLEHALTETRSTAPPALNGVPPAPKVVGVLPQVETGVERATLQRVLDATAAAPDGFTIHPKLARALERRRGELDRDEVEWAVGEALAFGSLVLEGHPVRLTGQDSRRGTFSQRHSVLIDYETEAEHIPLAKLDPEQAAFVPYDALLSEYASMAFEYGYTVMRPEALVLWEGQFGDFANGAQIVIDQFLAAAEDKWRQQSGLVLLLPHGYEGQGPEHSSARIERFLTLCAEDNIQVAQPTNAAQYFHLLRRQVIRAVRKPLIVITPKGLLRAKPASSPAADFERGSFLEVLPERGGPAHAEVRRVLLCSGRVAYDLIKHRDETSGPVAIVRVEQLYPWPEVQIRQTIESFPHVHEVFWVQDEPENMGPWPFVHGRLHKLLRADYILRHIARFESASPATGSATIHEQEQADLIARSFAGLEPQMAEAGAPEQVAASSQNAG